MTSLAGKGRKSSRSGRPRSVHGDERTRTISDQTVPGDQPDGLKRDYLEPDPEIVGDEVEPDHLGSLEGLDESRALALRVADIIAETPASSTLVLDIHQLTPWADFFVICSGDNQRQLRAITRDILDGLEEDGLLPRRTEGNELSGWTLLDFGDVVVHIFDPDQRAFYRLEERWAGGTTVLAIE